MKTTYICNNPTNVIYNIFKVFKDAIEFFGVYNPSLYSIHEMKMIKIEQINHVLLVMFKVVAPK